MQICHEVDILTIKLLSVIYNYRNLSRIVLDSLTKYEELAAIRSTAYSSMHCRNIGSHELFSEAVSNELVEEADEILTEFRTKLMALMDSAQAILRDRTDVRQSSLSVFSHASHSAVTESLEVSAVLERYSERLVEMVSDKISSSLKSKREEKP